jgi:hypothetical protein
MSRRIPATSSSGGVFLELVSCSRERPSAFQPGLILRTRDERFAARPGATLSSSLRAGEGLSSAVVELSPRL